VQGLSASLDCESELTSFGVPIGQSSRRACSILLQSGPLLLYPLLETALFLNKESREEITSIQLKRGGIFPFGNRGPELHHVTPHLLGIDAQLLAAPSKKDFTPQSIPKESEGLVEGIARPKVVQIGPEEREQLVAPVHTRRPGTREVNEEGEPLGLSENRLNLAARGVMKLHRPQCTQPNHPKPPWEDSSPVRPISPAVSRRKI
jgi:hypothetical protein